MTRDELSVLVADVLGEHFETMRTELRSLIVERVVARCNLQAVELRADLLEKLLQLRAPDFQLTPMGELYCDGKKIGDVRPVFRKVVADVLDEQARPKP